MTLTDEQAEQVIAAIRDQAKYWRGCRERTLPSDTFGRMFIDGKIKKAAALLDELEGMRK